MSQFPWDNTTNNIASQDDTRYETPGGAQAKADQAEQDANEYTDESLLSYKAQRINIADEAVGAEQLDSSLLQYTTNIAVANKFNEVDAKLAETEQHKVDWINAAKNGVDNTGALNASDSINLLIQTNDFKTLFFPDGTYNIDKEVLLNNYCDLKLGANAVFKCVANIDKMVNINRTSEAKKQFISGGIFDGNGKANTCIYSTFVADFQIYDCVIKNALLNNVDLNGGYAIYLDDIRLDNDLDYTINPNLTGIKITATDSVFGAITVKNNTKGVINNSVSSEFNSVHIWGNKLDRLPYTTGLEANVETRMSFFYADTCAVGIKTNNSAKVFLHLSQFLFNNTYLVQLPGLIPIFVDNPTGEVHIYNGRLSSYGSNIVIGTSLGRVKLYNCTFSTPFNTSSTYVNITNFDRKFYRISLSNFSVAANDYKRMSIPITGILSTDFYYVNLINDTSQFTNWKAYLTNGFLNIVYFNISASTVNLTGLSVNLTLTGNADNANIPVTSSSFTVV